MAVTLQVKLALMLVSVISVAFLGKLQVPTCIHADHRVIIINSSCWGKYLEIVKALAVDSHSSIVIRRLCLCKLGEC